MFNASGYPTSTVEAVGQTEARTTTYTRDATSNVAGRVVSTLGSSACSTGTGRVVVTEGNVVVTVMNTGGRVR